MPFAASNDAPCPASPPRGPWDGDPVAPGTVEIRMVAPRSPLPPGGKYLLAAAAVVAALLSIRYTLLGAWPVLAFSVMDIGALAVALHLFNRSAVPEERLRIRDGEVELIRSDSRRRRTRIALPAFWTRLETASRSEVDFRLWLVFREQRYPLGQCVSAEERRALAPRIARALARGR